MSLRVLDAGPLTTVQDLGRYGQAHLGVPRAGALDRGAATLANRLVGNPPSAAVLETTMGGVVVATDRALTLAVTGARAVVRVDGREVAHSAPVSVGSGSVVEVGPAVRGVRSYVACAGGIDVPPVLGSRSTDILAWVGPPPLAAGQVLPVGSPHGPPAGTDVLRDVTHSAVMTWRRGPRADWMGERSWDELDGATYAVLPDSDRIGLRLGGAELRRSRVGELDSEGIVLGAVQLPPSGQPVVFLADHPTTGGYPVVALVDDADLDWCGQLRPGDTVTVRVR